MALVAEQLERLERFVRPAPQPGHLVPLAAVHARMEHYIIRAGDLQKALYFGNVPKNGTGWILNRPGDAAASAALGHDGTKGVNAF